MRSQVNDAAFLAFSIGALLPGVHSQFVNALPRCIRDCITQSQYQNCQISDIACLCRASRGMFLPDLVNCMHSDCIDIDTNVLLAPLQFACELAGAPIPDAAVESAANQDSTTQVQVTKTVTMGEATRVVSTATVTTTEDDSTYTVVYPITIDQTTTVSGEPSTITTTTRDGPTALIPIIIVSTDSEGSTYTTTTSQPGSISTYTTTDSDGSTVTQESTITAAAGAQSVSTYTTTDSDGNTVTQESTATETAESQTSSSTSETSQDSATTTTNTDTTLSSSTTAAGAATTTTNTADNTGGSSQTSAGTDPTETNSAPFMDTNSSGTRLSVGALLGIGGLSLLALIFI